MYTITIKTVDNKIFKVEEKNVIGVKRLSHNVLNNGIKSKDRIYNKREIIGVYCKELLNIN